ncbi:hypothetical protein WR25_22299 [Diploscapter pachys]|uniref:BRCT domain-containing protein n=1 Tax=Diploscapter pachys TaxID=2018661 RepID=A0A2A2JU60_9BILA|nr:hypothetical protein WR25_22299 [Diploscapter pachys]
MPAFYYQQNEQVQKTIRAVFERYTDLGPDPPQWRSDASVAYFKHKLYYLGGYDDKIRNNTNRVDKPLMDSSKPRALHKSALAGRQLSQLRSESLQQENSDPNWSAMSTQEDEPKLYCLKIPVAENGPTKEETTELDSLYFELDKAGVDPRWARETAVDVSKGHKDFYLLPAFRGTTFNRLIANNIRIVGVPVVAECLSKRKPLPKRNHPVFSSHFSSTVITFTGFSSSQKEILRQLVLWMGGTVTPHLMSFTTHLVAAKCDTSSQKYIESSRLKIPVVSECWIGDAWKTVSTCSSDATSWTDQVIVDSYKLPIFTGFIFSISGVMGQDRTDFCRLVELNGGKVTAEMAKNVCTHLITDKTNSDKYRKAKQWGNIKAVTTRWVRKCVDGGYLITESGYDPGDIRESSTLVREQEKEKAAQAAAAAAEAEKNLLPQAANLNVFKVKSAPTPASGNGNQRHSSGTVISRKCSTPVGNETHTTPEEWEISRHGGKVMNVTNTTDSANQSLFQHLKDNPSHPPEGSVGNRDKTEIDHQEIARNDLTKSGERRPSLSMNRRPSQSLLREMTRRRLDVGDSPLQRPETADPSDEIHLTQSRGDFDFLDGYRIFIAGIHPSKEDQWKHIINRSGATRVVQLDVASHLVVYKPTEKDRQLIREARKLNLEVLHAQWLVDCYKERICLPASDYDFSLGPKALKPVVPPNQPSSSMSAQLQESTNSLHNICKITIPEGISQIINEISSQPSPNKSQSESICSVDIEMMLKIAVQNTAKPDELQIRKVHSDTVNVPRFSPSKNIRQQMNRVAGTAEARIDMETRVAMMRKSMKGRAEKDKDKDKDSGEGRLNEVIVELDEQEQSSYHIQQNFDSTGNTLLEENESQYTREQNELREKVERMNQMLAQQTGLRLSGENVAGSALATQIGISQGEKLMSTDAERQHSTLFSGRSRKESGQRETTPKETSVCRSTSNISNASADRVSSPLTSSAIPPSPAVMQAGSYVSMLNALENSRNVNSLGQIRTSEATLNPDAVDETTDRTRFSEIRKTPKLVAKNPRNATTISTSRPSTPITRLANEESEEIAARNGQGQGSSGSGGIPKQADTWTNDTETGETGTMNVNVPPRMTRSSTAAKRRATDEGSIVNESDAPLLKNSRVEKTTSGEGVSSGNSTGAGNSGKQPLINWGPKEPSRKDAEKPTTSRKNKDRKDFDFFESPGLSAAILQANSKKAKVTTPTRKTPSRKSKKS